MLKPIEELSRTQRYRRLRLGLTEDRRGKQANRAKGSSHYRWSDERMITTEGYVKVRVGTAHPLADANGYTYEHILIAVAAIGRPLADNEIVHHKNENRSDNRWGENLEVITRAEHGALHSAQRERSSTGQFLAREVQRVAV